MPQETVKRSVYVVYSMKDEQSANRLSMAPKSDADLMNMDPSLSNLVDYFKLGVFSTGFQFIIEDKVLKLASDALEIIEELAESTSYAVELIDSKMFYRLFEVGSYYIPREVRNSQESMQDSNFQVVDRFKSISDKAMKSMVRLVVMLFEGSLNAGSNEVDELLHDVESAAYNKLKENADTIRFEDNRKLADELHNVRTVLGDSVLKAIVKVHLEPDRVEMFRDDLISAPETLADSNLYTSHLPSPEKSKTDIGELRARMESQIQQLKLKESKRIIGLEQRSLT